MVIKRGTPKSSIFSEEHKAAMSRSHQLSEASQKHLLELHEFLRGRPKPLHMRGAIRASKFLRRLGISKAQAPVLWENYFEIFMEEIQEK